MRTKKSLSVIELSVLEFLRRYQASHGYPASIRDIGKGLGMRSSSLISYYLTNLESAGKIRREPNTARSIVVVEEG